MVDLHDGRVQRALTDLADVMSAPAETLPRRLSAMLATFVEHDALLVFAADADAGQRHGAGDPSFVERVSLLDLHELDRTSTPDTIGMGSVVVEGTPTPVLIATSRNGALLVLTVRAEPDEEDAGTVLRLWNTVALRTQELADHAPADFLVVARASARDRMDALTELTDDYSTTLASVLGALRSRSLDDRAARQTAIGIAAQGLVQLRTTGDRVRTVTEEPVTRAFARLRDDLRALLRYREVEVQFVEPPVDGRPLPSEVAYGARALVRSSILALTDRQQVSRVRVQWDCDGTNLLIDMRDDGPGEVSDASSQLQLIRQRIYALDGRLSIDATPGWGTEISIVLPLDPPSTGSVPAAWGLRPREVEVLALLATGAGNRAIALELGISENTVKFHTRRIYAGLGVRGRAGATALYLERGAVSTIS